MIVVGASPSRSKRRRELVPSSETRARRSAAIGRPGGAFLAAREGLVGQGAVAEVAVEGGTEADGRRHAIGRDRPEAGHRRRALALLVAEVGDTPCRRATSGGGAGAAAAGQLAAGAVREDQQPDVGPKRDVLVGLAIGDEGERAAVGRPGGLAVVAVAAGQLARGAGGSPGAGTSARKRWRRLPSR